MLPELIAHAYPHIKRITQSTRGHARSAPGKVMLVCKVVRIQLHLKPVSLIRKGCVHYSIRRKNEILIAEQAHLVTHVTNACRDSKTFNRLKRQCVLPPEIDLMFRGIGKPVTFFTISACAYQFMCIESITRNKAEAVEISGD